MRSLPFSKGLEYGFKRVFKKCNLRNNNIRIGVIGCAPGVGTTHLVLLLAGVCQNILGFRTAVVECNDNKDFIKQAINMKVKQEDHRIYMYRNITFICNSSQDYMLKDDRGYKIIIYDCGHIKESLPADFLRCNIKIGVLSVIQYRIGQSRRLLKEAAINCYVDVFGSESLVGELEREYGVRIGIIPLEKNPFSVGAGTVDWVINMVGRGT